MPGLPKYKPPPPAGLPTGFLCPREECVRPVVCRFWLKVPRARGAVVAVVYRCVECGQDLQLEFPAGEVASSERERPVRTGAAATRA